MPFWVGPMQVWAKRPPLSPKDKKPLPWIPLPKIHSRAPAKRRSWRRSTLYWGMPITPFPFSSGCCGYRTPLRLLRRCCDSIRSGIKSGTILVFSSFVRTNSYEFGAVPRLRGCEIRDRTCLVHRHRWLLEITHQRAERTDSKVKTDRARNGAIPSRGSRRKATALTDRRRRRTSFSHECGSASFVCAGDYEGIAKTSGVKREASVEAAHGNSQRAC